jgi:hypothetical protein
MLIHHIERRTRYWEGHYDGNRQYRSPLRFGIGEALSA